MLKTIALLTFIPRMRMLAPILAGSLKLPFNKFLLFESISLSVFTAIYIGLGIIFHDSLSAVMKKMKDLQPFVFSGTLLFVAVVFIIIERRRREKSR